MSHRLRTILIIAAVTGGLILGLLLAVDQAVDRSVEQARSDLETIAVASARQGRESSVAGCERTKGDRLDSVRGWKMARLARLKTAHNAEVPDGERLAAAAAAAVYAEVIAGFRSRIVDCTVAFPPVAVDRVRRVLDDLRESR